MVNVIIPSFTNDLAQSTRRRSGTTSAKRGVRVRRRAARVGGDDDPARVSGVLRVAADEAPGRQLFVHHSSWSEHETAVGLRIAEETEAELVLFSYPPNFYPSEAGHLRLHSAICDATSLGVMLFPVGLWGSPPASTPPTYRCGDPAVIEDCPNIVAIKAEGGYPSTFMGPVEAWRHFGEEVVISCPIEGHLIPLAQLMPISSRRRATPILRP